METISSGIDKLDTLLDGGFRVPSTVYIKGEPGTCKTTFGMQFLCRGAAEGEKGLYFSIIGESPIMVLNYQSQFGFMKEEYFEETIEFINLSEVLTNEGPGAALDAIRKYAVELNPKRIVIDPISPISQQVGMDMNRRNLLYEMYLDMKAWGCVTLILGEDLKVDNITTDEYMADGVIKLGFMEKGIESIRYLKVRKLRGANHSHKYHTLLVTPAGLSVTRFSEFD
jgi:circadian clock protein KaiC